MERREGGALWRCEVCLTLTLTLRFNNPNPNPNREEQGGHRGSAWRSDVVFEQPISQHHILFLLGEPCAPTNPLIVLIVHELGDGTRSLNETALSVGAVGLF